MEVGLSQKLPLVESSRELTVELLLVYSGPQPFSVFWAWEVWWWLYCSTSSGLILDGSIDLKCRRFNLKEFWERRESNPGLLGEKREGYLCAMPIVMILFCPFQSRDAEEQAVHRRPFCCPDPDGVQAGVISRQLKKKRFLSNGSSLFLRSTTIDAFPDSRRSSEVRCLRPIVAHVSGLRRRFCFQFLMNELKMFAKSSI